MVQHWNWCLRWEEAQSTPEEVCINYLLFDVKSCKIFSNAVEEWHSYTMLSSGVVTFKDNNFIAMVNFCLKGIKYTIMYTYLWVDLYKKQAASYINWKVFCYISSICFLILVSVEEPSLEEMAEYMEANRYSNYYLNSYL